MYLPAPAGSRRLGPCLLLKRQAIFSLAQQLLWQPERQRSCRGSWIQEPKCGIKSQSAEVNMNETIWSGNRTILDICFNWQRNLGKKHRQIDANMMICTPNSGDLTKNQRVCNSWACPRLKQHVWLCLAAGWLGWRLLRFLRSSMNALIA